MILDPKKYYDIFENDGENAVREKLAQGVYNEKKAKLAVEWLNAKREAKAEESASLAESYMKRNAVANWIIAVATVVLMLVGIVQFL